MALDIHVLDSDTARPENWPVRQFEEAVHSAIFSGEARVAQRYPLLRRMQDYYADARFSGSDLRRLVAELEKVVPEFAGNPPVQKVLRQFLEVCESAASQGKVVLCLCD